MKLKHIFLGAAVILSLDLPAQDPTKIMVIKQERYNIDMNPFSLADSCAVDSSSLAVSYFLNLNAPSENCRSRIRMQIGEQVIKQTDLHLYQKCIWIDNPMPFTPPKETNPITDQPAPQFWPSDIHLFFDQIQDRKSGEMRIIYGDFFKRNKPRKYTDSPKMEWTLTKKTDSLAGYFCNAATTTFRGRTWEAWYTTEIPIQAGPWKLGGLPGLILKATDKTGHYSFECYRIEAVKEPVYEYKFKRIQDIKTAEAYRKYERYCHEHPYDVYAEGEKVLVITTGKDKKRVYLDESWKQPYNPIEFD